jgi:diacylglycerol kinase family enzyme
VRLDIIANPIAGRGRVFKRLRKLLAAWPRSDWEVELHPTRCTGHAGALAAELLVRPPDLLAVCGGDGTLHEVVSSVPDPPFPVALIPAGTANVLAREIRLPRDPVRALEIALARTVGRVDLGVLRGRKTEHFLLMAGVGLDAHVVSRVRPNQRFSGIAAYCLAAIRALLTYEFPEFRITAGDEILPATSCLISHVRGYGGGLVFTPEAGMTGGLFELLVLQGRSRMRYARLLVTALLGNPAPAPDQRRRRLSSLRIDGPRGVWVQADGELVGALPQEMSVAPASYPLVVPPPAAI